MYYILLGNVLANISVKGQKVNISGIMGHAVCHSCPTLPFTAAPNTITKGMRKVTDNI